MDANTLSDIVVAITSVVALIISCITLYLGIRERIESNRGIICCCIEYNNIIDKTIFIIKNVGKSVATINYIKVNCDLKLKGNHESHRKPFCYFQNFSLTPNQRIIQELEYISSENLIIEYSYTTLNKTYKDVFKTNTEYSKSLVYWKSSSDNSSVQLKEINNTLLSIYGIFL